MYIYTICSTLKFKDMKIISNKGEIFSSVRDLCRKKNVAKTTVLRYLDKFGEFKSNGVVYTPYDELVEKVVSNRVKQIKSQEDKKTIKALTDELALLRKRQGLIDSLSNVGTIEIIPKEHSNNEADNTAVTLFSDVHWENRIDPDKVDFLNEYNPKIAKQRCENYFVRLCELIEEEQQHRPVSTLIIGVLGDLINGWLREEAMQTNYQAPLIALGEVKTMLISGLQYVKTHVKVDKIIVSCITANHGRGTAKIQHENHNETNLEYMVYVDLQQNAKLYGLDDIEIRVPKGIHDFIKIYGYTACLTHGHCGFKYSGGVGGIFVPLNKYFANLNNRRRVDFLLLGHYHSLSYLKNIVVNGSVCGIDAYAYNLNLPCEKPQQALFFISSKFGRTKTLPIFVD